MTRPINHPVFPYDGLNGKVNSGIGVRDFAALEIMKKTVHLFEADEASDCAREAYVFANAYMDQKEIERHIQ